MDIDSLKSFIAIAEAGSFSTAAQRLHLTQPAISKRIATLEKRLRHPLFDRKKREITLTEAGRALLPRARNVLLELEATERDILGLSGRVAGTLRLATSHHIGLHHLPPILRLFTAQYRDVNLHIEFLDSEVAYAKVLRGECELSIVTLAPKTEEPLVAETLWIDDLVFCVGENHPLAMAAPVTLKQLAQWSALLPDLRTYTGRLVKQHFDRAGLAIELNMTTNYLETIKMMVSVGLGWSVLPRTMLDGQLRELPIIDFSLQRRLGVVSNASRALGNAARAFKDVLSANRATTHGISQ